MQILSQSHLSEDQHNQTNIPYYVHQKPQTKKDKDKINKEAKDSKKNNKESKETKDIKDPTKIKAKSENSQFVKNQLKDNLSAHIKNAKQEIVEERSSALKLNIKEELSYLEFNKRSYLSQEKLARLYIQHKGDIQKLAFVLKIPRIQTICKMVLPIIKTTLRANQTIIKKRKLRRVFQPWNDHQLKEFIHKFLEIKDGTLEGYSKKIDLTTYWKLIESKYDNTITLKNDEALDFYKSCLDIHLSVYEDIENRGTDYDRHMIWSRKELKVLCRLLLKTDDLEKMSDVMMLEFGRLKDKYSTRRIFEKIDVLIKNSISKIKHQSITYPGLGEIRKIMKHDFYNINYNHEPRYDKIRKELIRYFEMDSPSLQQSYAILHKLNRFIIEERIYERNMVSEGIERNELVERNLRMERSGDGYEAEKEEGQERDANHSDPLHAGQSSRVGEVKVERAEVITGTNLAQSKVSERQSLEQSEVSSNKESAKQIHPQLKNLMCMELDLSSSSDEQQQNPKQVQGLVPIELQQ